LYKRNSVDKIRLLIVDDSKVIQEFLAHILSADPDIQVVGFAGNGAEAIELARVKKPDIITMDINMPDLDGFKTTRAIMASTPTPIVIVSGDSNASEQAKLFRSVEAGALAVLHRPPAPEHPDFRESCEELVQTIKLMSKVRVVKQFPGYAERKTNPDDTLTSLYSELNKVEVIAVGASTGGPAALKQILSGLPVDLPVPLLIVQHIAAGFLQGFTEWLTSISPIRIKIAEPDEKIESGVAYVAPDHYHMGITAGKKIVISREPSINGCRPSVSYLFRSVAQAVGKNGMGILLTGMGNDGADELKTMKETGAITIVQDEASSVVFGMPYEAIRLGAARLVLSPEEICRLLNQRKLKN